MKKCSISPIFYMGNKKKLINKGLIDLFPKDIDTFIDLFAGSGIVSMNTKANNYIINDINIHLYDLYNMFRMFSANAIIKHIESRIKEYGLPIERTSHKVFDDDRVEKYKAAYVKFRTDFNKSDKSNILDFYTLMFYSFSQQFRFNSAGDFNMPCGNDCFSEKNKEYIIEGSKFFSQVSVTTSNISFTDFNIGNLKKEDFVYLDPPYLNTTATYNENSGWCEREESSLYKLCEQLQNKHIKFGLSNVFENKGVTNSKLIDWCEKNNWNVYEFNKVSYSPCGRGNSHAREVLITNY